jgi:hypothetical protein
MINPRKGKKKQEILNIKKSIIHKFKKKKKNSQFKSQKGYYKWKMEKYEYL